MSTKTGIVTYVNENDWQGTMLYSFRLRDDDAYYSCGETHPDVNENDEIEFDFTRKGKRLNVDVDSIEVLDQAEPVAKPKKSSGDSRGRKTAPRGNSKGGSSSTAAPKTDWVLKDGQIRYAGALNTAIAYVQVLASQEKLPVKKSAKAESYADLMREFIFRTADDIWLQITGAPERLKDATPSFKDLEQPEDLEQEDELKPRRRKAAARPEVDPDDDDDEFGDD